MARLSTSVERLEGNKVRLHVAVPADEFEKAIDGAFRKLAREVKIPGFRPGKAPRRLLEVRLGSEVAREQALRDELPNYYRQAIEAEDLDTIAPPEIDITAGEETGDVEFDAVVEVRPVVELQGYDGLRVEIPYQDIDAAVDGQVDALRDRFADLEDTPAPLIDGSYATIDIKGYRHDEVIDGLSATDYLYEIGSGTLVPRLDEELRGKRLGDILKFNDTLPERFGEQAGQEVAFQVLVKATKRKVLPDATDEWVSEVSEFDTVDALRADLRTRLELAAKVQAQMLVRDQVLAAVADLVTIEIPETLVDSAVRSRLRDFEHRLAHQGITIDQYLTATGQEPEPFVAEMREGSHGTVKADLALRAIVAQEGIEVSDAEVDGEIERLAESLKEKPARVRRDLDRNGALEAVRSDLARSKALRFLIDHAQVFDEKGDAVDITIPPGTTAPGTSEPSSQEHNE
ncbi:MAG: trigger factor [Actinobacteria bacterium]|nr:MAG: trigger factor [Actinomycetota bacterium]